MFGTILSDLSWLFWSVQQMAVYSPVTAFLLLLASSLVLDTAIHLRRAEHQDGSGEYVRVCTVEPCGNVEAAGVSFLALLSVWKNDKGIFGDAIVYIFLYKHKVLRLEKVVVASFSKY